MPTSGGQPGEITKPGGNENTKVTCPNLNKITNTFQYHPKDGIRIIKLELVSGGMLYGKGSEKL